MTDYLRAKPKEYGQWGKLDRGKQIVVAEAHMSWEMEGGQGWWWLSG